MKKVKMDKVDRHIGLNAACDRDREPSGHLPFAFSCDQALTEGRPDAVSEKQSLRFSPWERGLFLLVLAFFATVLFAAPSFANCLNPAGTAGAIVYNESAMVPQYCNGFAWVAMRGQRYVPTTVTFDGVNDYLRRTSDLSGNANSDLLTGSFWFRASTNSDWQYEIIYSAGNSLDIAVGSDNTLEISIRNADNSTLILRWESTNTVRDNQWHHVMFSFDINNQSASHVYLDGVQDNNFTTFSQGAGPLRFTYPGHGLGAYADTESNLYDGDLADFWFGPGLYTDLSNAANRARFLSADNKPVDLGADGSKPLGQVPILYFSGPLADWHVNKGSGGTFTQHGSFSAAPFSPNRPASCAATGDLVQVGNLGLLTPPGEGLGVYAKDGFIFSAEAWQGGSTPFRVYSFNGSDFIEVDSYAGGHSFPEAIWSDGDYIYLGSPGTGLFVYAFDGTELSLLDSNTSDTTESRQMWGDGDYIYVPSGGEGFMAFTFDGANLQKVGNTLSSNAFAHAAYTDGSYVFLGDGGGGLRMYSFDGTNWSAIDQDTSVNVQRIWPHKDYLITTTGNGLAAFRYSAAGLVKLDTINLGAGTRGIWSAGDLVYSASGSAGIHVLSFKNEKFTLIDDHAVGGAIGLSVFGDGPYVYFGTSAGLYAFEAMNCLSCQNPARAEGTIVYNNTSHVLQYCDGEDWKALGPVPGTSGGGCSNPGGVAGAVVYNQSENVLQYCDSTRWVSVGRTSTLAMGLVAHWRLDETSGTTAFDSVGTSDGTMQNGLDAGNDSVPGMVGTALNFNGSGHRINIGNPPGIFDFGTSESFTFTTWIRPDTVSGLRRIISKGHTGWDSGFAIWLNGGHIISGTAGGSQAASALPETGNVISAGNWYHVAVVFDQTAKTARIYINGVAQNLSPFIGTCGTGGSTTFDYTACTASTATTAGYLYIGSANSEHFDGVIDDIRVYNRALSESEVEQLYNAAQ